MSPKHATASCSVTPADPLFIHPLVSCNLMTKVGKKHAFFVEELNHSLGLMLCNYDNSNFKIRSESTIYRIMGIMKYDLSKYEVHVDLEEKLLTKLFPFGTSTRFCPDVCVMQLSGDMVVPILDLEVQSSPLPNAVAKNVTNLITPFRLLQLLRHFNQDISRVRGFSFPRPAPTKFYCAIQATVSWKDFMFKIFC